MFGSNSDEHAGFHMLQTDKRFFLPIRLVATVVKDPFVIGRKTFFQIHGDFYRGVVVYRALMLKKFSGTAQRGRIGGSGLHNFKFLSVVHC